MVSAKKAVPVKGKKSTVKYYIDCKMPIEDNVIILNDLLEWMRQNIKVDGKKGALGTSIALSSEKSSIVVEPKITLSKRYLKYLMKKHLKKQDLQEFLRVIATKKNTYELKYFQVQNQEAE